MKHGLLRAAAALLLVVPVLVTAMPAAQAAVTQCEPGAVRYRIPTKSTKGVLNTDIVTALVPPNGDASMAITTSSSFTAGVTVSAQATFSAGAILAKAETSVGFSLQASGTTTKSYTVTVTAPNPTGKYHEYIFFDGERTARGTWEKDVCNSRGSWNTNVANGAWKSYHNQFYGAVRCDNDAAIASQYGKDSPYYTAAVLC